MTRFALLLLLFLLGYLGLTQLAFVPRKPLEFGVMTFNVRSSQMRDKGPRSWAQRRPVALAMVEQQGADIVGFQEVSGTQRRDLEAGLPGYTARGLGRDGRDQGEQCPLFWKSRFTALDSGTFWLSPTPNVPSTGWDASMRRICSWVRFSEFTVFNTHLDYAGPESRRQSLRMIRRRAKGSIIVLGDFNDRESSHALDPVDDLVDVYERMHPRVALGIHEVRPARDETTYTAFKGSDRVGARIDFILVSPDLEVISAEIVESTGDVLASDHSAVMAHLRKAR